LDIPAAGCWACPCGLVWSGGGPCSTAPCGLSDQLDGLSPSGPRCQCFVSPLNSFAWNLQILPLFWSSIATSLRVCSMHDRPLLQKCWRSLTWARPVKIL
jgi:hypothetical protein